MTSIEAAQRRILLVGNPMLVVCMIAGYMVVIRNGDYHFWEPYFYLTSVLACTGNTLALLFRPRTAGVVAYTTIAFVFFIIYARILSLFLGGAFENAPDKSMFISIFAYMPLVYMAVYVIHDARTGFRLSLLLWLLYVGVIGYFCWPIYQTNPTREGLDHLLLYSMVAHPAVLMIMAMVPRYSAAWQQAEENLQTSEENLREMAKAAMTDRLTGLRNRRFFDDRLSDLWRKSLATREALGVVLVDIDHFKSFNDHAGHLEGDRCLRRVAQALQSCLASKEDIARFGGEEFVVVVPGASRQSIELLTENLRKAVESLAVGHPAQANKMVTVSVGAAIVLGHPELGVRDVLALADDALYLAKGKGRNCTELIA